MTPEEESEIRKSVRELAEKVSAQTVRIETLVKIVKNHEHDKRDGCTKFDVGYL